VALGHTKGVYFLLMCIPVYNEKVYIDGIHKFIIYYVCCIVNQFLTCLGSRNYPWSLLGEKSAAHNITEGADPQQSHLLYVTLLGNMFGGDCQFIFTACVVFNITTELLLPLI
jgi:hypothetical protein